MPIGHSKSTGRYYDMETGREVSGAAAETGPWEAALIGAGRTVHNIGQNFGVFDKDPAADQAMEDLRTVNPKSTFTGEALASMTPVSRAFKGASMLSAGAGSYLTGDPDSSAAGRVGPGMGGQALGDMVGRVLSRGAKLIKESAPPLEGATDMARQFKDTGGRLTPAKATGSANLETLEGYLSSRVGSAGAISKLNEGNQAHANKLAMKAMGVSSTQRDKLTDDVLVEAADGIQQRFSRAAADIPAVQLDDGLSAQVRDLVGKGTQAQRVWAREVGIDLADDQPIIASGPAMMKIRSYASRRSTTSNENVKSEAISLIEQIDDLVEQNSDAGDAYKLARDQWRTLKSLDRTGSISSEGNLNPTSAYGRLRNWRDAPGDQGILRKNLQSASALQLPFGNSGTAQRTGNPLMMPANYLAGKAYVNAPASLAELGAGEASSLGFGTGGRGLLSPGGQRENYVEIE